MCVSAIGAVLMSGMCMVICLGSIILGQYYSSFCCVVMQVSREVRVCVCL